MSSFCSIKPKVFTTSTSKQFWRPLHLLSHWLFCLCLGPNFFNASSGGKGDTSSNLSIRNIACSTRHLHYTWLAAKRLTFFSTDTFFLTITLRSTRIVYLPYVGTQEVATFFGTTKWFRHEVGLMVGVGGWYNQEQLHYWYKKSLNQLDNLTSH